MEGPTLSLLVLKTQQIGRLRTFYAALGIALSEERHGGGPMHYAGRVGDVVLEIYPLPEAVAVADATTRLGFVVEKLVEVIDALQAIGATVVHKPQPTDWGVRVVVRDPDGRAVELYQR
jgi:hypothetical protein